MKNIQLTNYGFSCYDMPAIEQRLADYFKAYYDHREGEPFTAGAGDAQLTLTDRQDFHVQESSFVLLERAKMWEYNSHEYLYLFKAKHLTADAVNKAIEFALAEGLAQITPAAGHKCTVISAVFLCDTADADAAKAIRRCRHYKSFHFSFYGWMNFHTVLLERQTDRVLTNSAGRDKTKTMKYIFPRPKAKRQKG